MTAETIDTSKETGATPTKPKRKYTRKAGPKAAKKVAKKTIKKAAKGKGKVGRGYTPEKIQEVLDFLNANPGRGSKTKAAKKFGITYITISNWVKKQGGTTAKKAKNGRGRPKGSSKKTSGSGDTLDNLMAAIKAKKAELTDLLKQFEVEARSL